MPFVLQVQGQPGLPSEFQASQRDIGRLFLKNQKTNIQSSQWGKNNPKKSNNKTQTHLHVFLTMLYARDDSGDIFPSAVTDLNGHHGKCSVTPRRELLCADMEAIKNTK